MPHNRGPLPHTFENHVQFHKLETPSTVLRIGERDGIVMIGNSISAIKNILRGPDGDIVVLYSTYQHKSDFYKHPLPSSELGIYRIRQLSNRVLSARYQDLKQKYMLMPVIIDNRREGVAVPLRNVVL